MCDLNNKYQEFKLDESDMVENKGACCSSDDDSTYCKSIFNNEDSDIAQNTCSLEF